MKVHHVPQNCPQLRWNQLIYSTSAEAQSTTYFLLEGRSKRSAESVVQFFGSSYPSGLGMRVARKDN